jgi:hypothetical protein
LSTVAKVQFCNMDGVSVVCNTLSSSDAVDTLAFRLLFALVNSDEEILRYFRSSQVLDALHYYISKTEFLEGSHLESVTHFYLALLASSRAYMPGIPLTIFRVL